MNVHHLAVVVADLERSAAFYGGVLGLPVTKRWNDERGQPRSIWFGLAKGAFLAVERGDSALENRADAAPGWHCVAFAIETTEREAIKERLRAHGVDIIRESDFTVYVRDPDGNLLGFSHYPDK